MLACQKLKGENSIIPEHIQQNFREGFIVELVIITIISLKIKVTKHRTF